MTMLPEDADHFNDMMASVGMDQPQPHSVMVSTATANESNPLQNGGGQAPAQDVVAAGQQQQQQQQVVTQQTVNDGDKAAVKRESKPKPNDKTEEWERTRLFVGNLNKLTTTAENLKEYFNQFGDVISAYVITSPVSRKSRGFGYVKFSDPEATKKVLAVPIHTLDSRKIEPKYVAPKSNNGKLYVSRNSKKIFIGGVSRDTTADDVRAYFSQFGEVKTVVMVTEPYNPCHRGFGFVTFDSEDIVDNLCETQFHVINSKVVECKVAKSKEPEQTAAPADLLSDKGPMEVDASTGGHVAVVPVSQASNQPANVQQVAMCHQATVQQGTMYQEIVQQQGAVQQVAIQQVAMQQGTMQQVAMQQATVQQATMQQQGAMYQEIVQQQGAMYQEIVLQQGAMQQVAMQQATVQQGTMYQEIVQQQGTMYQEIVQQQGAMQQATVQQQGAMYQEIVQQQGAVQQASMQQQVAMQQATVQQATMEQQEAMYQEIVQQHGDMQQVALLQAAVQQVAVQQETVQVQAAMAAHNYNKMLAMNPELATNYQYASPYSMIASAATQQTAAAPQSASASATQAALLAYSLFSIDTNVSQENDWLSMPNVGDMDF